MSDDEHKPGFTRRDLVRGALVGAVAAGVAGKGEAAPLPSLEAEALLNGARPGPELAARAAEAAARRPSAKTPTRSASRA